MKLKTLFISILVTTLIYSLIVFMISPFLVSFGEKTFLNFIIDFLFSFPVNWKDLIVNKSLFFIVLNGLFWSTIGHFIYYVIIYIFKGVK